MGALSGDYGTRKLKNLQEIVLEFAGLLSDYTQNGTALYTEHLLYLENLSYQLHLCKITNIEFNVIHSGYVLTPCFIPCP